MDESPSDQTTAISDAPSSEDSATPEHLVALCISKYAEWFESGVFPTTTNQDDRINEQAVQFCRGACGDPVEMCLLFLRPFGPDLEKKCCSLLKRITRKAALLVFWFGSALTESNQVQNWNEELFREYARAHVSLWLPVSEAQRLKMAVLESNKREAEGDKMAAELQISEPLDLETELSETLGAGISEKLTCLQISLRETGKAEPDSFLQTILQLLERPFSALA